MLETANRLGHLTAEQISLFVMAFDTSCRNNAEFSEWSNELLFKVVQTQPQVFLKVLSTTDGFHRGLILRELKRPVNEPDLDSVQAAVQSVRAYPKTRQRVLRSLEAIPR
jgi:hypothetical protein